MTAPRAFSSTILAFLVTVTAAAAPPRAADEPHPTATVLCYHIVEAPAAPKMHITRDVFRQHLRYLEMTGYNVIPLRELYEYTIGKRASIPKNAVVITIDDGWRSTYTEAFPELQKRKFPFTVFIYPKIIGMTSNALSWAQVREMSDAGVDIQSHSLSHPYLTKGRHRFDDEGYAKWVTRELGESKKILEKHTGKKVEFLAYPYGDYDARLAKFVAKAGYSAALTCNFGRVKKGSNPLEMKRFVIDDRMDFAAFRRYLGATPLQIAAMTPKPGNVLDPGMTVVSAKIPKYDSLDPRSVGMALLSLGQATPYSYNARTGEITLALREAIGALPSKFHRAVVWGTELKTGKRVEATWVFRVGAPPVTPPMTPPAQQPLPAVTSVATNAAPVGGSPKR